MRLAAAMRKEEGCGDRVKVLHICASSSEQGQNKGAYAVGDDSSGRYSARLQCTLNTVLL